MNIEKLFSPPLFLADNLALDFINSEYGMGDERHDCFEDAHSVIDWLERAGLVPEGTEAPPELLTEARQLREAARAVVHAAMQSREAELTVIWPIADALVKLVTDEKFEYVRQCEAHNCVLLFHDLSKSHRRRWCSMATCGNRMKVAAFRNRKSS